MNFNDDNSTNKALDILKQNLENVCDIHQEKVKNPIIKLIGYDNSCNMDKEQLEFDLNKRNFDNNNEECKVLHTYKNKRNNTTTILIELPSELHAIVRNNRSKLYIGTQSCKVYDLINLNQCFKCGRFNHKATKCRNNTSCLKCASNHNLKDCKVNTIKCVNCTYSNEHYKTKHKVDHTSTDSYECEILKGKVRRLIRETDYVVEPVLPRFISNIQLIKESTLSKAVIKDKAAFSNSEKEDDEEEELQETYEIENSNKKKIIKKTESTITEHRPNTRNNKGNNGNGK